MQVVMNKKKKRKLSSKVTLYAQAVTAVHQRPPDVPNPGSNNLAPNQSKKKPWVDRSTTCSLKAASVLQIKKKSYKLGNIDAAYSCTDVTDYITTLGVRVTSCFALPGRGTQPPENINYRICVFATDLTVCINNMYTGLKKGICESHY